MVIPVAGVDDGVALVDRLAVKGGEIEAPPAHYARTTSSDSAPRLVIGRV